MTRPSVHRRPGLWRAVVAALAALLGASVAIGGDLDPPPGPVAPTMKPLDIVEPRIPIGPDTTPGNATATYRITASGSYYLTENLVGEPGKHGIEVFILPADQGDVSIDLNGMTMLGAPGSLSGVTAGVRVQISNGSIKQWGEDGVKVSSGIIRGLSVSFNGRDGIAASWGSVIESCTAESNTRDGVSIGDVSRVDNCVSKGNGRWGIHADGVVNISGCTIYTNDAGGVDIGISHVSGCLFFSNGVAGIIDRGQSTIRENTVHSSVVGILAQGDHSRIEGNHTVFCATGIEVTGTGNLIVANSARGFTTSFDIVPGNQAGAIVTTPIGAGPWDNLEQ